jgi:hypothetical protein
MKYSLPKLWLARIPEIWDRTLPANFPKSSSEFSLSYDKQEILDAVMKMEANLGTDESIIDSVVPEGSVCSGYLGTYDVTGEAGVETLLSPEKVNTENIIAMHYDVDAEEWSQIEDAHVVNGYVWGTLQSFSPIAIFTYIKDIHAETHVDGLSGSSFIVADGKAIKIAKDEEDGKTYVICGATGTKLELTNGTIVIGGSVDGTPVESTSVAVAPGVEIPTVKIVGGSVYVGEGFTTVKSVNVFAEDCKIKSLTGSYGAVRTEAVNFDLNGVTLSFLGCGEGYRQVGTPHPTFASRCWAKDVNMKLVNVIDNLTFIGQNCEYFYVHNTYAYVEGGKHDYLIMGGSNDGTNTTKMDVVDAEVGIFQTTNRGNVADAKATFVGCTVENLFVGGDATDSSVTGTTGKLRYEINASDHGSYNIVNGTEAGQLLTAEVADKIVDAVKVSRSANVTIAPELLDILGAKYIVK